MRNIRAILLGLTILCVIVIVICMYNDIQQKSYAVDDAWCVVEKIYRQRADVMQDIAMVASEHVPQNRDVISAFTEACVQARQLSHNVNKNIDVDEFQSAQRKMSSKFTQMVVAVDHNANLRASEKYGYLQRKLQEVEAKMVIARYQYNAAAMAFNRSMDLFPYSVINDLFFHRDRMLLTLDYKK